MRLVQVGLVLAVCIALVASISIENELSERKKGKGKKPGKKPVKPPAGGGKGSGVGGKGSGAGGKGSGVGGKGSGEGGKGSGVGGKGSGVGGKGSGAGGKGSGEGGKGSGVGGKGSGAGGKGTGTGGKGTGSGGKGTGAGGDWEAVWELFGQLNALLKEVEASAAAPPIGSGSGSGPDPCLDKPCGAECDISAGMMPVMRYCQPDGSCAPNAQPDCQGGSTGSGSGSASGATGGSTGSGSGSASGATGSGALAPGAEFHSPDEAYHTIMLDAAAALTPDTCMTGSAGCTGNCENDPANSYYSEVLFDDARVIMANGIPYHNYEQDATNPNPNQACEHRIVVSLPLNPAKGTFQISNMGPVGISVSGGFIFNHLSNPDGDLAVPNEGPSLDSCHGHSEPVCRYHYHDINLDGACTHEVENEAAVTLADATCHLIGWMLDGFPLYVCKGAGGDYPLKSCYVGSGDNVSGYTFTPSEACHLDEASGYDFPEGYGYLVTDTFPWVPMGYMGGEARDICYLDGSAGGAGGGKGGKGGKEGSGKEGSGKGGKEGSGKGGKEGSGKGGEEGSGKGGEEGSGKGGEVGSGKGGKEGSGKGGKEGSGKGGKGGKEGSGKEGSGKGGSGKPKPPSKGKGKGKGKGKPKGR